MNQFKRYLYAILVLLVLSAIQAFAQFHPILDKFSAFEANGKVYLNCVISSGQTCNGITILRSVDSMYFEPIAIIGGICGSTTTPVSYNYVDENPVKNQTSYYKLELGNNGFTRAISLFIVDTKDYGFQIRPNPTKDETTIYFENKSNQLFSIVLIDKNGNTLIESQTQTNFFKIDVSTLSAGIYFFQIQSEIGSQKIRGKIFVNN